MTVTPLRANPFQDCKELYQFLLAFKQSLNKNSSLYYSVGEETEGAAKEQTRILSISQEISPVDPLAVYGAMAQPDQLHFYWHNGATKEAIAAIDAAVSLKIEGEERFTHAGNFIHSCVTNMTSIGALNLPFAGPRFFCSFTFFDDHPNGNCDFPSATIFLPRWQVAFRESIWVVVANVEIHSKVNIQELSESLWHTFHKIKMAGVETRELSSLQYMAIDVGQRFIKKDVSDINHFKSSVLSALSSIEAKKINKIVLAHALDVKSPLPFQIIPSLNNLRKCHPDCNIFSTSNGNGKIFIGASPERLISINNQELVTDALAGSAARGKTAQSDADLANRLHNSEKERREHRVVIDFITQRLTKLGMTPQMLPVPQLLQLSNIQHLWTPIRAKVPASIHPLEIVAQLHPTPAVAGVPTKVACGEIRHYEPFDRCLYAAPLGWVDHKGNGEFIVGIRSALIDGDRARLYAGAGIVAGSVPDKELAEIQLKLKALLAALV